MKLRTRLALHSFGLRSIGVAIIVAQSTVAVEVAVRIPNALGFILGASLLFTATSNAFNLLSWWSNP